MTSAIQRIVLVLVAVVVTCVPAGGICAQPAETSPGQVAFFENKIRPLLATHCLKCHSAATGKTGGGLSMDSGEDMRRGGDSGPAVVPGDPGASLLIAAVEYRGETQMPPDKQLSEKQVAVLRTWIAAGAVDPRTKRPPARRPAEEHRAFKPVTRKPRVPEVEQKDWVKTPIDRFVLATLEEKGMTPASLPEKGSTIEQRRKKEALLRRASFDVLGLPPSPEQIREFVSDSTDEAFEKVIDRLLANPHFGERWARHWMDTARYSDTGGIPERGFEQRFAYAWGYRDWLIKAINDDMPYDEFLVHQLAADQVARKPNANWAALAFLTVGQGTSNLEEVVNEQIDTIGRGMLGLTIACARCHDHKFDPVTQKDYYALHGVFRSIRKPSEGPVINRSDPHEQEAYQARLRALQDHAWAVYLHIAKRENARMRAKAAAYFEYAFASSKGFTSDEDKKALEALAAKLHIEGDDGYWLRGEFAPNFKFNGRDPVLGPFVALADGNLTYYGEIMSGKRQGYHPVVLNFLRSQSSLPSGVEETAELFQRFWAETVEPIAGTPVDPKCTDFVAEVKRGNGMTTKIWELREKIVSHRDLPLMELAVFPWRLIAPDLPLRGSAHLAPTDALELKLLSECRGHDARGSELETVGKVNGINMFKLTNPGGPMRAMIVEDLPEPVNSPVYPRGNAPRGGDPAWQNPVPRRFIEFLSPGGPRPFVQGSGRLELARAIASRQNPLTARVMVNRAWMHLIGEGLVRTPDDMGMAAGDASHPELLDYLAWWFMQEMKDKPAWSLKGLLKLIMLSSTYQQSSLTPHLDEYEKIDPGNVFLWRANIRRLDFEAFRDSLLTMSGELDPTLYGPPVNLTSEPWSSRRSIYGYIDRASVPDLLMQFDFSNPTETNTRRTTTIVPQQALFLMNSPFIVGITRRIMERGDVRHALNAGRPEAVVRAIYYVVFQRTPTSTELAKAMRFLQVESFRQRDVVMQQRDVLVQAGKRAEELHAMEKARADVVARSAVLNEGELVERVPLTPWEAFVQALLFCNEAIYLN
jgi:mono/diheme cytochrome c family protein/cytochrome c553